VFLIRRGRESRKRRLSRRQAKQEAGKDKEKRSRNLVFKLASKEKEIILPCRSPN